MRTLTQLTLVASAALLSTAAMAQHSGHGSGRGSSNSSSSGSSSSSSSSSSSAFSTSRNQSHVIVRHGGGQTMQPGFHPGPNFRRHRLQRGFFVHPYWFGPQFHVQNWQLYGFAQPPRDHRWVRFYDDAYLIDRNGRVADHRYGLDWDEYGERWALEDGIPYYYGSNDWRPDDDDYAWVEGRGEREADWDVDEGTSVAYRRHGPPPACQHGPRPCGPSQAYPVQGHGYNYGVAYPPIIIETTVTTSGCCQEVVEEVVEVRQRPQRRHRPRAVRPRPRPPAGERG